MPYPDSILFNVTRPARYTGGEWNSITKDWHKADIKIALSYPDTYEIGMSNMALGILYDILNSQPGVLAERVFAPWPDMATAIEMARISLKSLESGHPLNEFDFIGFSLGYELTFTNVLNILHLSHIPVLANKRGDNHPIVIAGGSCALNPEPMSDFIDFFVIGEAEELLSELVIHFREWKNDKASRKELLQRVAVIPGIYVPSLYHVEYQPDGLFKNITPIAAKASSFIKRQIVPKLPPPVTRPVVPFIEVVHDRGAIEISRGCSRGCRFCNAGTIYRPVRQRPKEEILETVDGLITNCGYDEVSLVSLNTSDYKDIDKLIIEITQRYSSQNLALSLPSLRINRDSVRLIDTLSSRRKMGLTFAPETSSQRLQRVINKYIPREELLATAASAFEKGWRNLKLYFLLGLPTETEEDVNSITSLVHEIYALGKNTSGRRSQIHISLSTFVPKAHTPFQWVAMDNQVQLDKKHKVLKTGLRRKGIKLSWQETAMSLLEAVMSRGDRRLGKVIHHAWKSGAVFDGWSEHFNYKIWSCAFKEGGLKPEFYAQRQRSLDEPLPWEHIYTGISPAFLKREHKLAIEEELTPDCRLESCNTCGLEESQPDCHQKHAEI
ncbi:MAG: TIGR03960 family B12-binding radical SAM protein [Dehalococcoidia bacterium]|nr:MAG: TIGR03960 family B12-binding radical SAM protein [Dehalococcoidia bacterium]